MLAAIMAKRIVNPISTSLKGPRRSLVTPERAQPIDQVQMLLFRYVIPQSDLIVFVGNAARLG
jgi:hypothetical protein